MFTRIEDYFNLLTHQGPGSVYYTKPYIIVMIVHTDNIEAGKMFGIRHGFKVCKGGCYTGLYIKDDESKIDWLRECTMTWDRKIGTISKTLGKYHQESYTSVAGAIQTVDIYAMRHLVHRV